MTKLSQMLGFLFLAAGLALAVLMAVMPGSMQVLGLTYEVAAILLVGGAICVGLSGIHDALHVEHAMVHEPATIDDLRRMPATAERPKPAEGFGKSESKLTERVVTTGAAAAIVTETMAETRPSVADTIEALEQAKSEIASALGVDKGTAKPAPEPKPSIASIMEKPLGEKSGKPVEAPPVVLQMPAPPPPPAVEEAEEADDPDLYVVEEKVIRGRPARVLSDGTVEAETDEGWMRFENLEHLDEYLDAMSPGA
jgi:hypothetical protein